MSFLFIFISLLSVNIATRLWLSYRQTNCIDSHRHTVPEPFLDKITLPSHQRAADYNIGHQKLSRFEFVWGGIILLVWTLGGGLQAVSDLVMKMVPNTLFADTITILCILAINALLAAPLALYRTFVIEKVHGFNRTTLAVFISDSIKTLVVAALILSPTLYTILWLIGVSGHTWWIYAWLVYTLITLTLMWLFPIFISPLFNKFEPLEDLDLKAAIQSLLEKSGFTASGIFVMDGSRRSAHGNAYFTGLGKNKRIVFFDTLIDKLHQSEIIAVLAHELGHFKHKHILKGILLNTALSFLGFATLAWMMNQPELLASLGVTSGSAGLALLLFLLIIPLPLFFLTPIFSRQSRKQEYEADEYAAKTSNASDLVSSLVKMYDDNAATLTPDPVYSWFYASHPTALDRVAHLKHLND